MKIAEVIINTTVKSLDRVFHYLVPDNFQVEEGTRVEVPFGFANQKMVGYVSKLIDSSPYKDLKQIYRVIDKTPLISGSMLAVARFVRSRCLCSMSEALRLLLPPAVKIIYETMVIAQAHTASLSPVQQQVYQMLQKSGGKMELKKLMQSCEAKNDASIRAMEKKGAVSTIRRALGGAKEKIRKYAVLAISPEEALALLPQLKKRGVAMNRAMEMLAEHLRLPVSDLAQYTGCSYQSLQQLERDGYIEIEDTVIFRSPYDSNSFEKTDAYTPTREQQSALDKIYPEMENSAPRPILLYGVTGSGKTEVFLQAAQRCISLGKNVIILVPEISLTPQMTERFIARFGSTVAVIHSGLSLGERYDEWRRIKENAVKVVVGARSAIFAPFENIGLIVIDEEQELTYKSEVSPRYNAKDIATFRAKQFGALLLLASATPSVESFYKAQKNEYQLLRLSGRYNMQIMPKVSIVDMASELAEGNRSIISRTLAYEIDQNIQKNQQTILFLNRRGYSTFVSCRSCGFTLKCPHCSISLTYHSEGEKLSCHYCGYQTVQVVSCPSCSSRYIKYFGSGTQKAEDELKKMFPKATMIRMDADTASHKMAHQQIFDRFSKENVNILLGTQMVTKGLDFPNVTLVGVIAADALLNMSDYRAGERAFSQLMQVCGRAGRGDIPGRAVIQTYSPDDSIIHLASVHNYDDFFSGEIQIRQSLENPPFSMMVNMIISSEKEEKAEEYALVLNKIVKEEMNEDICTAIFPAAQAPISLLRGRYRYRILLKVNECAQMYGVLENIYNEHIERNSGVSLEIDINPNSIL